MTLSFRAGLILLLISSCAAPARQSPENTPNIHATVLTIRTSIQPANKAYTHALFIANGLARSGDEVDEWRLVDFAKRRVTFVDDLTGTYRSEPFNEVVTSHRAGMARSVPDGMPRAQFSVTGAQKTLQGVVARQSIIRLGAYQRELWIASHPLIPEGLYAILQASEPLSSPLAGIMRAADEALLEVKGFPLADHAELPYENQKLVVDNTIVKIEQRDVPASWLTVRADYREQNPTPAGKPPQTK